jgi:D-alanyl-D-alanine carboxypeptidase
MRSDIGQRIIDFAGPWHIERVEDEHIPGLAMMISSADGDVWTSCVGYADMEQGVLLTPDHRFPAASQTKTFTALATLQLARDNILHLSDPVSQYVPEIMGHEQIDSKKITIDNLLTHTSGLLRDGHDCDYWAQIRPFPTTDEMLASIRSEGILPEQAGRMKYSNIGYALLGLCLERATQKSYEAIIDERIVQPLGLVSTSFQPTYESHATGYGRQDSLGKRRRIPALFDNAAYTPATGIYSTVRDLSTFYTALSSINGPLDPIVREAINRPRVTVDYDKELKYGYGVDIGRLNGRAIIGHGGGYPGFTSKTITEQLHGLTVSVMTNCIDGNALHSAIGMMDVIDFFARNGVGETVKQFNTYVSDIWRDRQVVATNKTIVSIDSHSWFPFRSTEELLYVDDATLRISKTNGFESEGELVHFYTDRIRYAGRTMMKSSQLIR